MTEKKVESATPTRRRKSNKNFYAAFLGVGMSIATEIAVACFLGYFLGQWLDKRFGTDPYLMLFLMILCLSASLLHATIVLKHLINRLEKDD